MPLVRTSSEVGVEEGGCLATRGESQVRLQVAADRVASKHTAETRNRGRPGPADRSVTTSEAGDGAGRANGELRVSCDCARETSRGVKAGPRTGLRRRVRVPALEAKQGVRADRDDDVPADGVGRPAGGEHEGT